MKNILMIGEPLWSDQDILAEIDNFAAIYADRPIKDNGGGMKAPHMFAVWFMVKRLSPDLIVESGIWKGQSTWLLEKACPEAKLVSIDLNLRKRQYISKSASYSDRDFSEHDWSDVTDRSLVFFDDHQNAYKRLLQCKWFGFKHMIFEDNYPVTQGDCYSLKKAFAHAGFQSANHKRHRSSNGLFLKLVNRAACLMGFSQFSGIHQYETVNIRPNDIDSKFIKKHLEIYYEFPPVFKTDRTRWGDDWNDETYPTQRPLLQQVLKPSHEAFFNEADCYTWICYAKFK